jgi:hypothetical protein
MVKRPTPDIIALTQCDPRWGHASARWRCSRSHAGQINRTDQASGVVAKSWCPL